MTRVRLAATASYLPERWMGAAEISALSGIPEQVLAGKFGLRGKHIAAPGEHVSDMAATVARRLLAERGMEPSEVDALVYFGSTWKDYEVWHAAPRVAHLTGCDRAAVLELSYVSCGSPVAVRVCRDLLRAEDELRTVLAVAASRESSLIDYGNPRTRFAYDFGDGAVAALFVKETGDGGRVAREVLGCHMITDGSFSRDVMVPAGGSAEPASHDTVRARRHLLDVPDPAGMKERLDPVTLPNFLAAADGALRRSGARRRDVSYLCGIHVKRSLHDALVKELGLPADRAMYLDDTGHMSGVDPLFALDRADRAGLLAPGDLVLLLAAGTGYTWAASVIRW
ncbi:3-oxoacyl-ACP synthase [Sphaerisporangium perillae]|uniref:3-oxoacyl-ACP synthase n=1 Tax=Sphaerisporangium perillae TaxID=2935860 RepID=UPI00200F32FC|nr:3-oxoacyl-ACP synthase [Sphaerisporangium perillae]